MENITLHKQVHASSGQETARFLTQPGEPGWTAEQYPAYVELDLGELYHIHQIRIHTARPGYTQYAVYLSREGRDFQRVCNHMEKTPCPDDGEPISLNKTARFVRVLVKYVSNSCKASLLSIEAYGAKAAEAAPAKPELYVPSFSGCRWDRVPTEQDTVKALEGIVERNLGAEYLQWFQFSVDPSVKRDSFTLSMTGNRVQITGNTGVSIACGLNYYLKEFCFVNIAQVGCQVKLPESPPVLPAAVSRETPFPLRYAYNYCTHSYTMAFWGAEEWQKELDWLALNGVNLVLDITAQEEVWRRFLGKLGYTHQEIKDFLVGPAYGAWAYMANLSGFGGPLHDGWFAQRTELARKNHFFMREMGMVPVLQGYSGMAPCDIRTKQPRARSIPQGKWNGFQRPAMLRTNTRAYHVFAALFYEAQREVYGDASRYFATDPFHEGGRRGGLSAKTVGRHVVEALRRENEENVWVIQAWGMNPSPGLLRGLRRHKENALVLDLYAEKRPRWKGRGKAEFRDTPWIYCMLNNFGGRMGLHGHMETIAGAAAQAQHEAHRLRGIGITPEATRSNPVLFDLFLETAWTDRGEQLKPVELERWLPAYARRRYGAESLYARQALELLRRTVYHPRYNMIGEGAPESVVNARPAWEIKAASTWGSTVISYDKRELEEVLRLLLLDYETLKESSGYCFDLADCIKQVLSNTAQEIHKALASAFFQKDAVALQRHSRRFFACVDLAERVLATQPDFLLGTWLGQANRLAEGTDDFTRDVFRFNAKALITTWGSRRQADGGLRDYSNRQWAGLTGDLYRARWKRFLHAAGEELEGKPAQPQDWFAMEWQWVWEEKEYSTRPNGENLRLLGAEALKLCGEISRT